jgi:hypothetical protein
MEIQHSAADPRLCAILEIGQGWTLEQGLILAELECVLCLADRLLHVYRGRLSVERLPVSLRTPRELMAWARPEVAKGDVTGLERSANCFARWLVLCLPGEEDLQNAVCCAILIQARARAQSFVY